jgi:hypothetical protein
MRLNQTMRLRLNVFSCISLFLFPFAAVAADLPSFNATCAGRTSVHADEGGPVYVNGREATLRRFSDTYFEAKEARGDAVVSITTTSGAPMVSFSGGDGSNGVCRLEWQKDTDASSIRIPSIVRVEPRGYDDRDTDVTCESVDREKKECDMDTRGDVRMIKQLSRKRCTQGENWGVSKHSVWVTDGCRAQFRNFTRDR